MRISDYKLQCGSGRIRTRKGNQTWWLKSFWPWIMITCCHHRTFLQINWTFHSISTHMFTCCSCHCQSWILVTLLTGRKSRKDINKVEGSEHALNSLYGVVRGERVCTESEVPLSLNHWAQQGGRRTLQSTLQVTFNPTSAFSTVYSLFMKQVGNTNL